jgi:hypothetical protein
VQVKTVNGGIVTALADKICEIDTYRRPGRQQTEWLDLPG